MKIPQPTRHLRSFLPVRALAAALAIAWGHASAQTVDRFILLTTPESYLRAGAGYLDDDSARFGQYSGLADSGAYGVLDIGLVRRDNETGTWLTLFGRNLGLDSREAMFQVRRQGHWRVLAAYDETPRTSQYATRTALEGIGGTTLAVQPSGHRDVVPETRRERGTIGLERIFANGISVSVRASSEKKDGTRLFGRGTFAGGAVFNYLAEPIDRTTHELDATVGWVGKRLQLQGGYRGSLFDSHATSLEVTGGSPGFNGAGAGTLSPIALPPGNQAHHLFASGAWELGPGSTVRGNFKAAYTRATQDEPFVGNPPGVADTETTGNISGRTNLDGELVTTLLFAGVSARPLPKLDVNGSLRYEDRDDRTPLARYLTVTGAASSDGYNEPRSVRFTTAKASAGYQLPDGYKLVGNLELERQERDTSPVRVVAHRDRVDEATARVDLRRAFSDTVNGTLVAAHSRRDGSDFTFTTRLDGSPYSNLVAPVFLADRERDRLRLELDWQAAEPLNVQLQAEGARDRYDTRYDLGLGVRRGESTFVAIDAQYDVSRDLRLTAWVSHSVNAMEQSTTPGAAFGAASPAAGIVQSVWAADLDLESRAVGIGVRGRVRPRITYGAELQHTRDRSRHDLSAVTGPEIASLPAIAYDATTLRLWGVYEVSADFGVRIDYEFDRRKIDDWTWRGFTYVSDFDGTTISTDPDPRAHFVAISAYWRWR